MSDRMEAELDEEHRMFLLEIIRCIFRPSLGNYDIFTRIGWVKKLYLGAYLEAGDETE